MIAPMSNTFVDNTICSCTEKETCASCRFCMTRNTPDGRKALCEKITHFLVLQPFYQSALAQIMGETFSNMVVYDDEKDICTMLFEALLFEYNRKRSVNQNLCEIGFVLNRSTHNGIPPGSKELYQFSFTDENQSTGSWILA